VILLGGQAKGESFAPLVPLLARHRAVVCFGGSGPVVADELVRLGVDVVRVGPLDEAVAVARSLARPGDAVVLSPACASFDAFRNFEHRGQVFAALARGPEGGSA
jgi:UDP-N-acetylmuramoylalanine--D-glutamate ligase